MLIHMGISTSQQNENIFYDTLCCYRVPLLQRLKIGVVWT